MKKMILLSLLGVGMLAPGCKKNATEAGDTLATETEPVTGSASAQGSEPTLTAEPEDARDEAVVVSDDPSVDPVAGKWTLEDATEGLEGDGKLMARIKTPRGDLSCELFADAAPETVASFVGLARGLRPWLDPEQRKWVKQPFFDGLLFHRVIPNFMIQGGDHLSRDHRNPRVGTGSPGYTLPDEIVPELKFDKPGRLAMANSGPRTHSGGSQFFVTEGPVPRLDGDYVIFGQCDNVEVVKQIARVPVSGPTGTQPTEPVTMNVDIFRK